MRQQITAGCGAEDHHLIVDVAMLRDAHSMDLEDLRAGLLIGQWDLYLAVQAARPHERRI